MHNHYKLLLLFLFVSLTSIAQTGILSGKITDENNNQALAGASIIVAGISKKIFSESDGTYRITGLASGKHTLEITYVGYETKRISDIEILKGQVTTLNIILTPASGDLKTVVVTSTSAKKESFNALLATRRNAAVVSDGISADLIRKSPDKNTSDVLKRISGTSVQENKYVVVRGMNDRYNEAMLNGFLLPSSEPDRKTFAFDIFPSEVVDNITIYKSASPDLPGSFAGGLVQVTTKDVPDKSFLSIKGSIGFNRLTINNDFRTYPGSSTDWLGYDNSVRVIPPAVDKTSTLDFNQVKLDDPAAKTALDRNFKNTWGIQTMPSSPLNGSFQLTGGFNAKLSKTSNYPRLGGIFGITYNSSFVYTRQNRTYYFDPYNATPDYVDFQFIDSQYVNNILSSALANFSYRIDKNNKLFFNNILSMNSFDQTVTRGGSYQALSRSHIQAYSYFFVSNRLYNGQVGGEHYLPNSKIKINWTGYYTDLVRKEPDYRFITYSRETETDPYYAVLAYGGALATTESGLRFYGEVEDYTKGGNADINVPFKLFNKNQNFKFGGGYYYDDRKRNIRYFNTNSPDNPTSESGNYIFLPVDQIFDETHFDATNGLYFSEPQLAENSYSGFVRNAFGYMMFDNKLTKNLRFVWGMRLENYRNQISGLSPAFEPTVFADIKKADWLPSGNLIYSVLPKANLRMSYGRTVTRPLFRELSPQVFYDFFLNITYFGNVELQPTYINNYELRWEHFFNNSQYYSVSLFYKDLTNSIEPRVFNPSGESLSQIYANVPSAKNRGIELELRKNFDFIGKAFENLVLYTNFSFVESEVSATDIVNSKSPYRPLFGQSPYIVNASLQYTEPKTNIGFSVLFNQAGTRIWLMDGIYANIVWEKPRPILDCKLMLPILKKRGSVEFSWSDILQADGIFFNDINDNQRYDKGTDITTISRNFGYSMSLAFGYKF